MHCIKNTNTLNMCIAIKELKYRIFNITVPKFKILENKCNLPVVQNIKLI